jgi:hypothetical protein
MGDLKLREFERIYSANPSTINGRKLYEYLFRVGRNKEAEAIRQELGYVDVIKSLPRPTDAQCKKFVEYVATAHSWYKHLSADNPTTFYVYLDPGVMVFGNGDEVTEDHNSGI